MRNITLANLITLAGVYLDKTFIEEQNIKVRKVLLNKIKAEVRFLPMIVLCLFAIAVLLSYAFFSMSFGIIQFYEGEQQLVFNTWVSSGILLVLLAIVLSIPIIVYLKRKRQEIDSLKALVVPKESFLSPLTNQLKIEQKRFVADYMPKLKNDLIMTNARHYH